MIIHLHDWAAFWMNELQLVMELNLGLALSVQSKTRLVHFISTPVCLNAVWSIPDQILVLVVYLLHHFLTQIIEKKNLTCALVRFWTINIVAHHLFIVSSSNFHKVPAVFSPIVALLMEVSMLMFIKTDLFALTSTLFTLEEILRQFGGHTTRSHSKNITSAQPEQKVLLWTMWTFNREFWGHCSLKAKAAESLR